MNALFLKHLADKTRRGQRGRVEEGLAAGRRTAIDKDLRDIAGRAKRILTAIEEGTDTPDMRRRLMEMEGKRTQLEREAKELGEPAVVEMHPVWRISGAAMSRPRIAHRPTFRDPQRNAPAKLRAGRASWML